MKTFRLALVALFLVIGPSMTACGDSNEGANGRGVVRGVDLEKAQVTIEHEEIPGLMGAMTMKFEVVHPSVLEGVQEGEPINFRVRHADGKYTVLSIERR